MLNAGERMRRGGEVRNDEVDKRTKQTLNFARVRAAA